MQAELEEGILRTQMSGRLWSRGRTTSSFTLWENSWCKCREGSTGIEKTEFPGTLERHKIIAENEDNECWVAHLGQCKRRIERRDDQEPVKTLINHTWFNLENMSL